MNRLSVYRKYIRAYLVQCTCHLNLHIVKFFCPAMNCCRWDGLTHKFVISWAKRCDIIRHISAIVLWQNSISIQTKYSNAHSHWPEYSLMSFTLKFCELNPCRNLRRPRSNLPMSSCQWLLQSEAERHIVTESQIVPHLIQQLYREFFLSLLLVLGEQLPT